jgi:hypothetical protein
MRFVISRLAKVFSGKDIDTKTRFFEKEWWLEQYAALWTYFVRDSSGLR